EKAVREKRLVSDEAAMTGAIIRSARVVPAGTGMNPHPSVGLRFTPAGAKAFGRTTGENVGRRLAIILNTVRDRDGAILNKGTCQSAPLIRARIQGEAIISGNFSPAEVKSLQAVLMAGALPAPITLESESRVER
ncbi:MAG: SecDF P1 head subdomain-containing protein, partial [Planctomycetota bacterium]